MKTCRQGDLLSFNTMDRNRWIELLFKTNKRYQRFIAWSTDFIALVPNVDVH